MKYLGKIFLIMSMLLMSVMPAFAEEAAEEDTEVPSDVTNVQAVAGDAEIALTWDVATDNVGVTGYNLYYGTASVTGEDEANYTEFEEVGDAIEYTLAGLENETEYFFALTAVDAAGNESEYYSVETSATPTSGEEAPAEEGAEEEDADADAEAPQVVSAEALYSTEVKVVFSENVVLPSEYPEDAFTVQNNSTLEVLDISAVAYGDNNDTVVLTTASQDEGIAYIVTVGIAVEDISENPIISGVSDVAEFTGLSAVKPGEEEETEEEEEVDEEDATPPMIAGVESLSDTEIKVTFTEKVNLSVDPTENFGIALESDEESTLLIEKIELEDEDFTVAITTEKQLPVTYLLTVLSVEDKNGNVISEEEDANEVTFSGKGETTLLDLVAPENVTNLVSNVLNGAINLSWNASLNTDNDLSQYVIYKSEDGIVFDNGTQIPADATTHTLYGLEPGGQYYFKVTASDETGNESSGAESSATLPATGPGIGLLALASLGAGFLGKFRNR